MYLFILGILIYILITRRIKVYIYIYCTFRQNPLQKLCTCICSKEQYKEIHIFISCFVLKDCQNSIGKGIWRRRGSMFPIAFAEQNLSNLEAKGTHFFFLWSFQEFLCETNFLLKLYFDLFFMFLSHPFFFFGATFKAFPISEIAIVNTFPLSLKLFS